MKPGILVISHGSHEPEWVNLVDTAVYNAAEGLEAPVVSSFLEIVHGRLIQDGIDELEKQGVTKLLVLPLFVSSGSTHVEEISQAFGFPPLAGFRGDLSEFRVQANVTYGYPIDDDPELVELLLENVSELSCGLDKAALLLIGHGSKVPFFYERWRKGLFSLAERLRTLGGFAYADFATLLPDEASIKLAEIKRVRPDDAVIVVPVFLSEGYFTKHVIPSRLKGLHYGYNGRAMLPHPAVERWLTRQISEWLSRIESC